jgi:Protein of unknown function (DUF3108)
MVHRLAPSHFVPLRICVAAGLALLVAATAGGSAHAQGKLEAGYTISVARIPIGSATASIDIEGGRYTISMTGRASGVARVLASGEGTMTTRGTLRDGRPLAATYISTTTSEDDTLAVTMTLEDGNVKELTASPPPPGEERVPLTEAHHRNIIDPLTALLVPAADGEDGLSEAVCARTLPIFDGRRRYDLKLAFKRMERVKAGQGYAGPVIVCSLVFQPIAGHRASSPLLSFLSGGREMEIAFAPVAGTRVLAPFRITVMNLLGNLAIQASRFEAMTPASVGSSAPNDVR